MKKKGFTLVEIIACVIILSLIAVIVLAKISGNNKKQEEYDKLVVTIENAAKLYYLETNSTDLYVDVSKLVSEQYMDSTINPITNEVMTGCVIKGVSDGISTYTYSENCQFNVTVTFNPNGGTVSTQTKTVINNSTYGDLPTPTRTNYTFLGWYTDLLGTEEITKNSTVSVKSNIVLFALWEPITVTLTFDANGGTVSTSSKTISYGSTYGDLPTPTRTNYRFEGWYTASSGGDLVSTSTEATASATLYAHWALQQLIITYDKPFICNGTTKSSGTCVVDSSDWEIWFLETGNLTISNISSNVDISVIGGGGGGGGAEGNNSIWSYHCGNGGNGGQIVNITNVSLSQTTYSIKVGAGGSSGIGNNDLNSNQCYGGAGGNSSFGSIATASGGAGGKVQADNDSAYSGSGLGGKGSTVYYTMSKGEDGTNGSCPFGATTNCSIMGSGGGGGSTGYNAGGTGGSGAGTGGAGGNNGGTHRGGNATSYGSGGGGGVTQDGAAYGGGTGKQGVVILRNHR